MPDTVNGIPSHPLVVHFAVVLTTLAIVMAVLFLVPRTRGWARLPYPIVSIAALVAVFLAKESGEGLEQRVEGGGGALEKLIHDHAEAADLLFVFSLLFAVISVVAWFVATKRPERMTGGVGVAVSVLVVAGLLAIGIQSYRVGDLGAKAVWNHSVQLQPAGSGGEDHDGG